MRRIKNISELTQGDTVVRCHCSGQNIFMTYVCPHIYNKDFSIFLDGSMQPMQFYNKKFEAEDWILFDHTDEAWLEVHETSLAYKKADLDRFESRVNCLRNKIAAKNELHDETAITGEN